VDEHESDPRVIVDFDFEDGSLFVAVENISSLPVRDVRVEFSPPFRHAGGRREIGELELFRRLRFLAPGKRIRAYVDEASAYFERGEPTEVAAHIEYHTTSARHRHRHVVHHDLEIYRDLGYIRRSLP
jgi:hypothetical protein